MDYLKQDGAEGVTRKINSMTSELLGVMARTGFSTVADIDSSVMWQR
jgi:isopentenyl diphosphate isomerase/L-lactate dehydrogenase-like FMN-dependent dehydrogenase